MIEIIKPDDFHIHLRQDDLLPFTLKCAEMNFGKVLAMPNLNPPLLKVENVVNYHNKNK
jgi:dihydroorotase